MLLDTIPACDKRTDGWTDRSCHGIVPTMHMRREKIEDRFSHFDIMWCVMDREADRPTCNSTVQTMHSIMQ